MKIRTKIIWISCIAVVAASLIGDVVIWLLAKESMQKEAFIMGYQNCCDIINRIKEGADFGDDVTLSNRYYEYYFKSLKDDYNICIRSVQNEQQKQQFIEIYNHTVIDAESLNAINYKSYGASANSEMLDYAELELQGGRYIVFCKQLTPEVFFYRIEDTSNVSNRLGQLMLCLLVITLVLTIFTSLTLSIVLRKVFMPLQHLNETTKQMAKGQYDKRLIIKGVDEISQLGESFNKMAEAIEARTCSLKQSEQKKTLFMGNLTHELKTPMTAISGYAQTLLSTKLNEEQKQAALLYIYEECNRLERLSMKMMKLLELDQEDDLELILTPISDVFDVVLQSCSAHLKEKQIELEIFEHGELFLIDADLMTDALINLIDNAVKASKEGGKIILKAERHCIEVEDFGQGIPLDEQEKILEPFYMIDKSRSRKGGGAGLGLALTALIVRRHHIAMQIKSDVGKGTRVILQFV